MTIIIEMVQIEARKVNLAVRNVTIQLGFNKAHNVWLVHFY